MHGNGKIERVAHAASTFSKLCGEPLGVWKVEENEYEIKRPALSWGVEEAFDHMENSLACFFFSFSHLIHCNVVVQTAIPGTIFKLIFVLLGRRGTLFEQQVPDNEQQNATNHANGNDNCLGVVVATRRGRGRRRCGDSSCTCHSK